MNIEQDHLSWLDTPDNMICLLNSAEPRRWRRVDPGDTRITPLWEQERWPQFHNRLLKRIFRELRKHRLGHKIIASYTAPSLYQELEGRLPVRLIYNYLSNMLPRRILVRRLRGIQPAMDVEGNHAVAGQRYGEWESHVHCIPAPANAEVSG